MSRGADFSYSGGDRPARERYEPTEVYEFAKKKFGNEGREIPVFANFVPIKVNCNTIYHYNIEITVQDLIKEKDDKNVPQRNRLLQQKRLVKEFNFAVFHRLLKQETGLFSSEAIYDGRKNMYSKTKLSLPTDRGSYVVKHKIPEKKFPVPFNVIITTPKDSHEIDLSLLNDKNIKSAEKELQALDIILQYGPKIYKLAIGSNFFLRNEDLMQMNLNDRKRIRFDLGELKEVSYGHYQSVKLTQNGTQMNVDRVAVVLKKGGRLTDLIGQIAGEIRAGKQRNDAPPPRPVEVNNSFRLNGNERYFLNNELKGLIFEVDHISYKPRNKIFALTDKSVSEIFFEQRTRDSDKTVKVSVKEYFERTYPDYLERQGRNGLNGNLPCVQVGKINAKFFPVECVTIVHDQYTMKSLPPTLQGKMTRTCGQQAPPERFREGMQQVRALNQPKAGETDYLKLFNLSLDCNYAQVKGRVLEPANLLFFGNKTLPAKDGQWRPQSYVIPATNIGDKWMIINFSTIYQNNCRSPRKEELDDLVKTLVSCSKQFGLQLSNPCERIYNEVYKGKNDLSEAITEYLTDHKDLKLMIFVIPRQDELYSHIKFLSELNFGVVTQCVSQEKNRQYNAMTYVSNLMLKINAKLGGTNLHLAPNCKVGFLKKKTMIMGLDVTHPGKHDRLGNSIASVVATYDSKMTNYYAKCVVQPSPRCEIVLLDQLTQDMLENFQRSTKMLPDYVLVYRDGVSEGQFQEVVDKEINLMKKAFANISPTYNPKITFIVVQKRHHTRFLAVNERDRISKSQNVLPGTVIDNGITSNYFFDFYLCSHFGALGTTRPTRYVVLHDDSEFNGDEIQKTTNLLTHLFPRCPKAVSIVPAVLYAHLAAKRARSYLFVLDNNRGTVFGEQELSPSEITDLNKKIEVKENLRNILYYV